VKTRKKILDFEYEETLDIKTKKHFAVAKDAGATEAELIEAMAYGIIAPSGKAKNFSKRMFAELDLDE
jgi:alkylhydroperoxidase/carboxymuconolactone decarboxylase family protein YurZ